MTQKPILQKVKIPREKSMLEYLTTHQESLVTLDEYELSLVSPSVIILCDQLIYLNIVKANAKEGWIEIMSLVTDSNGEPKRTRVNRIEGTVVIFYLFEGTLITKDALEMIKDEKGKITLKEDNDVPSSRKGKHEAEEQGIPAKERVPTRDGQTVH